MNIDDLEEKTAQLLPKVNRVQVRRAYEYASQAHANQKRNSGEPYINHPLAVASILTELEVDEPTLLAALLHDVVEDTGATLEEISQEFGAEAATLVDGVTKISGINYASQEERNLENLRKILLAMAQDIRVVVIKLADRLHNLRTLNYLPRDKQQLVARETLEIFAPLASRLGIYKLKWELEDLSFRYLEPDLYFDLARRMQRKRSERERILHESRQILLGELTQAKISGEVQYRAKHLYSVQQKMDKDQIPFEEIYDLLGLRVVVRDVSTCYEALGLVHAVFTPLPGRLKDYIAMPKPNLYQSLHTVVIGPQGEPMEIQIRTEEMHRTAELGIAAHWRYKEGGKRNSQMEEKMVWLRSLLDWQKELTDSREFLERVKVDLFADEVLVFTPKGEVINLPVGATPVDFAFQIHSQVGQHCAGAKVNGRITSLDTALHTGDRVEILTRPTAAPSLDWLGFVRATSTKSKIRAFFRKKDKVENLADGKVIFDKHLRRFLTGAKFSQAMEAFALAGEEDLYLALGTGALSPVQILQFLARAEAEEKASGEPKLVPLAPSPPLQLQGTEGMVVRLAGCCLPLPGDEVVGFITQGRGIAIHRSDCPNLAKLPDPGRKMEVSWPPHLKQTAFTAALYLRTANRPGVLKEITTTIADDNVNIQEIKAYPMASESTGIQLKVTVRDLGQLQHLINRLERIPSVNETVRR
ncbi:MAG: bifunctional (p)ppGpp synthetase/guanosine-3',5'-bis(diphosphate) 3'-pyrophosphohydrolase [Coprothermobacterota bacterium]|nr:bifunctional (p)ppGpp synthetase/guanosine-3',5'-bis(diphosphate) 3'-pyrophosphohydrolase [Coprothermobacterota bacterium]